MADIKNLEKAREAVKKKNFEYAVHLFIVHLTTNPGDVGARKELRDAERQQKKLSGGGGGLFGGMKKGALGAKVSMIGLKDPEKAMLACEDVLKQDPDIIPALLKLGEAASHAGHNDVAVSVLEDALTVEKDNKEALRLLGRVFKGTDQLDRALKCFNRLSKLDPKDKEAEEEVRNIPARLTSKTLEKGAKEGGFTKLIDTKEAGALEKQGKRVRSPEEALARIAEMEPIVAKNPKDTKTMRLIAEMYVKAERVDDAVKWCERAIEANPHDFAVVEMRGDLMLSRGETAVKTLEEAYKKSGGDEKVKAKLAKAKADLLALQVEEFSKRVEAHPTEFGLRFVLGKALFESERFDEAITELQKAKQDARRKSEAGFYLGRCFVQKKIPKLALNELNAAREGLTDMEGVNKDITYLVGRIYEGAGKKDQALAEYSKIAEVDFGYKDVTKRLEGLS